MKKALLLFLLLGLLAQPVQAMSAMFNRETVITKLLDWTTKNAARYEELYGVAPAGAYTYTVFGKDYVGLMVSIDGYAEAFKNTGGPVLNRISGTDFSFLMDPSGFFFIVYTAFLSLMVGFFWFKTLSEVTTGKSPAAITPIVVPLIGKLAVGLVVAYNMPFVYGMAMKLKELGMQVVSLAFSNGAANLAVKASPNALGIAAARDNAVKDGVERVLPGLTTIIDSDNPETPADEMETGKAFLAYATALLNEKIEHFKANAKLAHRVYPNTNSSTIEWGDVHDKTINFVGFTPGETTGKCPYGDQTTLTTTQAKDPDLILAHWMADSESTAWMQQEFSTTLGQYIRLSSRTVTNDTHFNALDSIMAGDFYKLNSGQLSPLGADLESTDIEFSDLSLGDATKLKQYTNKITDITTAYIDTEFIKALTPSETPSTTSGWKTVAKWTAILASGPPGWGLYTNYKQIKKVKDAAGAVYEFIRDLPKMLAEMSLSCLKFFWIPALALLADFLFNVTIEAYVYVLMLAYPLWFYQKTAKAFMGALNSLISVASTAAVFAIMIFIFEGFGGNILENIIGMESINKVMGSDLSAAAVQGTVGTLIALSPIGNSVLVGIIIGYCVFYTIGTGICLAIAPKITKAFYNGSSVVTPMLMGAATAVAGGVLGGAMIGAAAAGAGMGGLPGAGMARGAIAKTGKGVAAGAQKMAAGAKKAASNIGSKLTMASKSTADLKNMASAGGMAKVKASGAMAARGIGGAMGAVGSTVGGLAKRGANFVQERPMAKFAATQMAAMKQNPSAYLRSLGSSAPAKVAAITLAGMSGQMGKMFGAAGTMIYGQQMLNSMANRKESEGVNVSPSVDQISNANAETQRKIDNLNKDTAIRKKPIKLDRSGNSNNNK